VIRRFKPEHFFFTASARGCHHFLFLESHFRPTATEATSKGELFVHDETCAVEVIENMRFTLDPADDDCLISLISPETRASLVSGLRSADLFLTNHIYSLALLSLTAMNDLENQVSNYRMFKKKMVGNSLRS
jgi:hypothetical protein